MLLRTITPFGFTARKAISKPSLLPVQSTTTSKEESIEDEEDEDDEDDDEDEADSEEAAAEVEEDGSRKTCERIIL